MFDFFITCSRLLILPEEEWTSEIPSHKKENLICRDGCPVHTTYLAAEQRWPLDLNADRISDRSKCCRLRLVDTCLASPHLIIKPTDFAHHSSSRPTRVGAAKAVSLHSVHRLQCPARTSAPRTSLSNRMTSVSVPRACWRSRCGTVGVTAPLAVFLPDNRGRRTGHRP